MKRRMRKMIGLLAAAALLLPLTACENHPAPSDLPIDSTPLRPSTPLPASTTLAEDVLPTTEVVPAEPAMPQEIAIDLPPAGGQKYREWYRVSSYGTMPDVSARITDSVGGAAVVHSVENGTFWQVFGLYDPVENPDAFYDLVTYRFTCEDFRFLSCTPCETRLSESFAESAVPADSLQDGEYCTEFLFDLNTYVRCAVTVRGEALEISAFQAGTDAGVSYCGTYTLEDGVLTAALEYRPHIDGEDTFFSDIGTVRGRVLRSDDGLTAFVFEEVQSPYVMIPAASMPLLFYSQS